MAYYQNNINISGALSFTGAIVAPQITATENNYNIAGENDSSIFYISSNNPGNEIRGLTAPTSATDQVRRYINTGGVNIKFTNNSGFATAANRMILGGNVILSTNDTIVVVYDQIVQRWRLW